MTPSEFKIWFDGFTEAIDGVPTPEQWAKVKEKIAQVREVNWTTPITPHVPSIPAYDPNRPWWDSPITYSTDSTGSLPSPAGNATVWNCGIRPSS